MRVVIGAYSCEIFPTDEDVHNVCKIGQGKDTCIFLTMGAKGWSCVALDWQMRMQLEDRADEKQGRPMNAGRKGCMEVNNFNPAGMELGSEIHLTPD